MEACDIGGGKPHCVERASICGGSCAS